MSLINSQFYVIPIDIKMSAIKLTIPIQDIFNPKRVKIIDFNPFNCDNTVTSKFR